MLPCSTVFANPTSRYFSKHDEHEDGVKSTDIIPACDVVIAEVSYPSTGQGIELGWANANDIPIICFYRKDAKISGALRFISNSHIEYSSQDEMIKKLQAEIQDKTIKRVKTVKLKRLNPKEGEFVV